MVYIILDESFVFHNLGKEIHVDAIAIERRMVSGGRGDKDGLPSVIESTVKL